ncbi:MAG: hypothetical protein LiPW41_569 [Parcubacteria group bacterium LiPW_41]|nr:MAG: hypothetical protein LiPW41_569 [Parcubacteria group bacterium LiPW_41]
MSKLQARLYLLYPVLLGVIVLLLSALFARSNNLLHMYQLEFSIGVVLTAGIVSFFFNQKTDNTGWLAVVMLNVSLVIIWAFIILILPTASGLGNIVVFPLSIAGFVKTMVISVVLFLVLGFIFHLVRSFFEWIFKEEHSKETDGPVK